MAPPEKPRFRTVPIAILSSVLPDAVAVAQKVDAERFMVEHSLLEPETQYPFLLSTLSSLTTTFAAAIPISSPQKKSSQPNNGNHGRSGSTGGFTLVDGSWWYRIIATRPKYQTESQANSAKKEDGKQESQMSRLRCDIDAALWKSLTEVAADLTLSFWKDWKTLDCPMAFDLLMADLSLGVRWSHEDNVLVLFIHNLQKKRDQSELHFFLRRQPDFPLKFPDPQLTAPVAAARKGPAKNRDSDESANRSTSGPAKRRPRVVTQPQTPPPTSPVKEKPTPYIPPHRQHLHELPCKPSSPRPHPLRSNPTFTQEPNPIFPFGFNISFIDPPTNSMKATVPE